MDPAYKLWPNEMLSYEDKTGKGGRTKRIRKNEETYHGSSDYYEPGRAAWRKPFGPGSVSIEPT